MSNTQELSNLEIRNLILEVLGYEKDDIDLEGNTFKKYGYQGSTADLYRLLDGLLIVKRIRTGDLKGRAAAWGTNGLTLYEGSTTYLTRSEILKLYQEFNNLLTQGVIAPGAYGHYGDHLPFFHVTEYGLKCVGERELLPYDQDGYLAKLKQVQGVDEWIVFYITEALRCFNANCINSSMINIGLAGEVIIEKLCEGFLAFLEKNNSDHHISFERELANERQVSAKYNVYNKFRDRYSKLPEGTDLKGMLASLDKSSTAIYATYTRLTRNSVTHPNEIIMDRMKVLMFFITFVDYCELQYKFLNYYNHNSN
ncbi:hypothetical protein PPOLYM_02539 [Paenibacillus polymyxa]|uniref:hypothetical protein n=1 Tax=Paenibacillus polymyxa TaxID=1406 RepID=UPI00094773B0|nr:hypothetical protein [Paenibacillus polymyxa]APQ59832.1 hypothetical protein VK72_14510 [Paenibacillus polymyxa]VUG06146.1 hypothetical protein PPOLYM_02539 [Paenibacillus polymyxa]